ncbi:MAG: peptidyl-prolyl cis-trans isomerase [Verrucomicrobia bacterium]|nr:peptidyl-prolyl cis-trans isomerase [Verrucomicrobiota bacterium]
MKKLILLLTVAAPMLFAQTNAPAPLLTAIDGYAARVDSTVITYGEVRESVTPFIQQLMRNYKGRELAERMQAAYLDARESLIEEALLKAETKTRGLSLPDKAVDDEMNRLIRDRFNNDRAMLTRALTARRMTYEEWKKEVREQITLRIFYSQEVSRRANVPAEAAIAEYERNKKDYFIPFKVKYSFILINKGKTEEDLAAKRKLAEDTLQKLRNGADFSITAKVVSEGDQDVSPWRELGDVREALRPALLKTSAGQISDLIETPEEFYILRIEERREQGCIPFEEAKKSIEAKLLEAEKDRLHKALIKTITANHFVERY